MVLSVDNVGNVCLRQLAAIRIRLFRKMDISLPAVALYLGFLLWGITDLFLIVLNDGVECQEITVDQPTFKEFILVLDNTVVLLFHEGHTEMLGIHLENLSLFLSDTPEDFILDDGVVREQRLLVCSRVVGEGIH